MATERTVLLTKNKFIHKSPKQLGLGDLFDGIKKTRSFDCKIEGFWFAYEDQWLTEFPHSDQFVYEVVISPDKFVSLDDPSDLNKILEIKPSDIGRFRTLFTKKKALKKNEIISKYGGLYFSDYDKSNCWDLWYNTLDVSSGSIWNVKAIVEDLRFIGKTDWITQQKDDNDYVEDFVDIVPL